MSKRATSHDVAREAGVSRSVVSAVLNGTPGIGVGADTREAVLAAIRKLDYRVDAQARGMRTGKSRCFAAYGSMKDPSFLPVLQGLQQALGNQGYHVLIYGRMITPSNRSELLDLFRQRRIDGIVTKDSTSYADMQWAEEVSRAGIPYVSVEGYPENPEVASVITDYSEGIRRALDFLWERHGLPPVYVELFNGKVHDPAWGDRKRSAAYRSWMEDRGWEPNMLVRPDEPWLSSADAWIAWLRAQPLPVAVLTNWSRASIHLYRAAQRLGLSVGRDLFVLSADNTERVNAHLVPSLSFIEVPYVEMGIAAGERIIEYAEGVRELSDTESIRIPQKLVGGESA